MLGARGVRAHHLRHPAGSEPVRAQEAARGPAQAVGS